jgi:hypothetical protein
MNQNFLQEEPQSEYISPIVLSPKEATRRGIGNKPTLAEQYLIQNRAELVNFLWGLRDPEEQERLPEANQSLVTFVERSTIARDIILEVSRKAESLRISVNLNQEKFSLIFARFLTYLYLDARKEHRTLTDGVIDKAITLSITACTVAFTPSILHLPRVIPFLTVPVSGTALLLCLIAAGINEELKRR